MMMIDIARARRALEMALRGLTMYAHAMEDLGVPIEDAAQGPQDAPGRATDGAGIARPDAASPVPLAAAAKKCAHCGKTYRPHPQGAHRSAYCSPRCRLKAAAERRAKSEDAEYRAQTAELRELHASEGYTNGS